MGAVKIRSRRKSKDNIDYRTFFLVGISLSGTGIVLAVAVGIAMGIAFIGSGITFLAIGLANRDKWK